MAKPSLDRRGLLGFGLAIPSVGLASIVQANETPPPLKPRLTPMSRFLGTWRGKGEGQAGISSVERSYTSVLGGNFILVRNVSTYAPQERNRTGERHEDLGFYSFDKARKRLVLRQFHVESFFAQYVAASEALDGPQLVFNSEAIENIPAGFRARETYRFSGNDRLEEIFETADPGATFELYSHTRLERSGA